MLKKNKISKLLKISDPFLMIDNLSIRKDKKKSISEKKIKSNDWFFKCHFLNEPVMPGTLQIEAMLQSIVTTLYLIDKNEKNKYLITKTNTNFYLKIDKPGKLSINSEILKNENGFIEAKAFIIYKKRKISDGNFKFVKFKKFKIKK